MLQTHLGSPRISDTNPSAFAMYNNDPKITHSKNNFFHRASVPFNSYNRQPNSFAYPDVQQKPFESETISSLDHFSANQELLNHHQSNTHQPPFYPISHNTAYLPTSVSTNIANASNTTKTNVHHTNISQQEEISTIFVVGFPDDMQEREFQNMFTFSAGFEAATLKIPNKEFTSYGPNNTVAAPGAMSRYPSSYSGSNDLYNSTSIMGDNLRDGAANWNAPSGDDHFAGSQPSQPPRKQIIGFAKFRTRQEALEARDVLQGRRVDIEKGAVLKAEMAKKNLHTKRGPVAAGPTSVDSDRELQPMSTRERELGTLAAIFSGARRNLDDVTPGARVLREHGEEDERRHGEKEVFNSGPQHNIPRYASQPSMQDSTPTFANTVWGNGRKYSITPRAAMSSDASPRPMSPVSSPKKSNAMSGSEDSHSAAGSVTFSPPAQTFSVALPVNTNVHSHTSHAHVFASGLGNGTGHGFAHLYSEAHPGHAHPSLPLKPPSEESGSEVDEGETSDSNLNAISTGSTSPASVPSGGTGGAALSASSIRGNPGDQNPPINTLYVGNLPSSSSPSGYSTTCLEDELRDLFAKRPGYRKLCFRNKNGSPMCFVEFDDVSYASRALRELQGHTLNGLVKAGGIRLSYSKNPLGVRTPTTATGTATSGTPVTSLSGMQVQQQREREIREREAVGRESFHSAPPISEFFPPEGMPRQFNGNAAPRFAPATANAAPNSHYTHAPREYGPARSIQTQYGLDSALHSSTSMSPPNSGSVIGSGGFSPFRNSNSPGPAPRGYLSATEMVHSKSVGYRPHDHSGMTGGLSSSALSSTV